MAFKMNGFSPFFVNAEKPFILNAIIILF